VNLANVLLAKLRARATQEEINVLLNGYIRTGSTDGSGATDASGPVDETRLGQAREVLFQSVLLLGSKSFSHMLNVTER
jgi:hypothetical protein